MIIVEGPDGSGKTTLVQELCDTFPLTVGERGAKDRDKLYESTRPDTYTALGAAVRGDAYPQVWDRLFFSELVYSPVMDRECQFNVEEQNFIRRILKTLGCPIIVCMPPWDVVVENVQNEKQMDGVEENLQKIYEAYQSVFADMPWVLWYDYTGEIDLAAYHKLSSIKRAVRAYLDRRESRSWS